MLENNGVTQYGKLLKQYKRFAFVLFQNNNKNLNFSEQLLSVLT